ncbi:glutaredoxin-C1-like [Aristolochia californica]|uniref:glutaredoxin-C1-like n=1 Tax=Aristolochia californica TaxID=171875 RepID=UPI0035DC7EAB
MDRILAMASQHPVLIFSLTSCCMCHTVKTLFFEIGANPAVHELDEDPNGRQIESVLIKLTGKRPAVPVVFIGGQLVGTTDRVMSLHLGGSLVPMLRQARAL